jgi:hypothetical protein
MYYSLDATSTFYLPSTKIQFIIPLPSISHTLQGYNCSGNFHSQQTIFHIFHSDGTMQSQSAADLSCSVCNQILHDNEDSIQCSGVCDISVHPKCFGLKKSEKKILQEGSGLLWFCDHCRIVGTNVSSLLMAHIHQRQLKLTVG